MGTALARKNEIVGWYPPLQTFWTTGVAASITTFSTWMEEGYLAFSNFEGYNRGGFYDVSHPMRSES
jgi:fluoride ion exporter CrcB/FEX